MFDFFKKPINSAEKIVDSLINLPIEKIEKVTFYGLYLGEHRTEYGITRKDGREFIISTKEARNPFCLYSGFFNFGRVRKSRIKAFKKRVREIDKIFKDKEIEQEEQAVLNWENQDVK